MASVRPHNRTEHAPRTKGALQPFRPLEQMEVFSFTDLIEDGEPIRVLARVSVLRTEEGGKSKPFTKGYRPNHNFGEPESNKFYIGQIELPENTPIHSGETHDVLITFLPGPGLNELLHPGRRWRIQEGSKLVARGQVLRRQGEA